MTAKPTYEELEERIRILEQEILKKKGAEKTIQESDEKYRTLYEKIEIAISVVQDGFIKTSNPKLRELLGGSIEELTSRPFTDFIHPEDRAMVQDRHVRRLRGEEIPTTYSYRIVNMSGETRQIEINVAPASWEGKPAAICFLIDITDRNKTEEALRKSEELFRRVFQTSPDSISLAGPDGSYINVNEGFLVSTGLTREEALGATSEALNIWVDTSDLDKLKKVLQAEGIITNFETQFYGRDGTINTALLSASVFEIDGEWHTLSISREINALKKAEEALRESEKNYRLLANNVVDVIWTMDTAQNMTYISPSVRQLRGFTVEEAMAQSLSEKFLASSQEKALETFAMAAKSNKPIIFEAEQPRKDGSTIWTEISVRNFTDDSGNQIGQIGITRDITERKRAAEEKRELEKKLQQTQKMEAIGTLAGGIAHDFNNILGAIFAFTQLAQNKLPESPESKIINEYLSKIHAAGIRARDLVNQILTISRKVDYELKAIDLVPLVKESIKFLQATLPSSISIKYQIDPGLNKIKGDYTQIHQIIMNLCTNASHSMEQKGGELKVSLNNFNVVSQSLESAQVKPGRYVVLMVRDSGVGMDEETQKRIFEPYYTNKEQGKGTGLGLSVVHGIIEKHGGGIFVYSRPGFGTKINVYLPATEEDMIDFEEVLKQDLPTGSETILFIDDEKDIRNAYKDMLETQGYKVQTMSSSQSALKEFQNNPGGYDLVITDYTMPELNGIELSKEILNNKENVPIILISGLGEMIRDEDLKSAGIVARYSKPIEFEALIRGVREALDGRIND